MQQRINHSFRSSQASKGGGQGQGQGQGKDFVFRTISRKVAINGKKSQTVLSKLKIHIGGRKLD